MQLSNNVPLLTNYVSTFNHNYTNIYNRDHAHTFHTGLKG